MPLRIRCFLLVFTAFVFAHYFIVFRMNAFRAAWWAVARLKLVSELAKELILASSKLTWNQENKPEIF
jgi:hypothetical protein